VRVTRYATGYVGGFDVQTTLRRTEADLLRGSVAIKEIIKV
jgi:hypothetical protein